MDGDVAGAGVRAADTVRPLSRDRWQQAPTTVRVAVGALLLIVWSVPLLGGLGYVLDPEPPPVAGLSATQFGYVLVALLLFAVGWLLLLAYLLLRRSRSAWLLVVGTGVLSLGSPGETDLRLFTVLSHGLVLATFLPLLAPSSVRWFWQRDGRPDWVHVPSTDLRRPD